jgi:hypothetical protein
MAPVGHRLPASPALRWTSLSFVMVLSIESVLAYISCLQDAALVRLLCMNTAHRPIHNVTTSSIITDTLLWLLYIKLESSL